MNRPPFAIHPDADPGRADRVSLRFYLFTYANTLFLIGKTIIRIYLFWLLWEQTRSTTWLSVVAALEFLPLLILPAFLGPLAARFSHAAILLNCQIGNVVFALAIFVLFHFQKLSPGFLASFFLLSGLSSGIFLPTRLCLIESLVDKTHLAYAISLTATTGFVANLVGPLCLGAATGVISTQGILAVAVSLHLPFLIVTVWLSRVRHGAQPGSIGLPGGGKTQGIVAAVSFLTKSDHMIEVWTALIVVSMTARSIMLLYPQLADYFSLPGAAGLSWMSAATAFGATLGSWAFERKEARDRKPILTISSFCVFIIMIVMVFLHENMYVNLAVMFLLGLVSGMNMTYCQWALQSFVPQKYSEHAMGIYTIITFGLPSIGSLVLGSAASAIGIPMSLLGSVGCAGLFWVGMKSIRHRSGAGVVL